MKIKNLLSQYWVNIDVDHYNGQFSVTSNPEDLNTTYTAVLWAAHTTGCKRVAFSDNSFGLCLVKRVFLPLPVNLFRNTILSVLFSAVTWNLHPTFHLCIKSVNSGVFHAAAPPKGDLHLTCTYKCFTLCAYVSMPYLWRIFSAKGELGLQTIFTMLKMHMPVWGRF